MRCAAMLRGINVSGHRKITMGDLVTVCGRLGFHNVETYAQSGNIVFDSGRSMSPRVATALERAIDETFGHDDVTVILRDAAQLAHMITINPFLTTTDTDTADTTHTKALYVTLLTTSPANGLEDDGAFAPDRFVVADHDVYVCCPDGYGRSKINNQFFERKLGVRATTRNWRTITTLAAMTSR